MPPDATETRRRILEAGHREFAEFGLAGARVDRIAEKADANKRSIYVHYGTKEELFDIVLARNLQSMIETAPLDPLDLPGSAARLYDMLCERPDVLRLTQWALLERPQPIAEELVAYRERINQLRAAQQEGQVNAELDAPTLFAMTIALASSWGNAPWALRAAAAAPPNPATAPHRLRRSVAKAVAALADPPRGRAQ